MPSELCLCASIVGAWWSIALTTLFWKDLSCVQGPQNIRKDSSFPYRNFRRNRNLDHISTDSDSDYGTLLDSRGSVVPPLMENMVKSMCDSLDKSSVRSYGSTESFDILD